MLPLVPALLAMLGCTRIDVNHHAILPATGLDDVEVTLERGSFTWSGGARVPEIDVDVWSWGIAANEARARGVEESNDWGALVLDGTAAFWGLCPSPRGGVDVAAFGPKRLDIDAVALDGIVELERVNGDVIVTADGITALGIGGSADLYAWQHGIDATVWPSTGDVITLHAQRGNVRLGIPAGLDVDIVATGADGVFAQDLLYDAYAGGNDWFEAWRGDQTITIRIVAERGLVDLYEVGS